MRASASRRTVVTMPSRHTALIQETHRQRSSEPGDTRSRSHDNKRRGERRGELTYIRPTGEGYDGGSNTRNEPCSVQFSLCLHLRVSLIIC